MKTLRILLGALAVTLASSWSALAATPTPIATPAATQTPVTVATSTPVVALRKQVGTSASFLKFITSGTCTLNPASMASGYSSVYTCTALGAKLGDFASVTVVYSNTAEENTSLQRDCFYIHGAAVTADDTLTFRLNTRDNVPNAAVCDPNSTTFQYLILRANPGA